MRLLIKEALGLDGYGSSNKVIEQRAVKASRDVINWMTGEHRDLFLMQGILHETITDEVLVQAFEGKLAPGAALIVERPPFDPKHRTSRACDLYVAQRKAALQQKAKELVAMPLHSRTSYRQMLRRLVWRAWRRASEDVKLEYLARADAAAAAAPPRQSRKNNKNPKP